MRATSIVIVGSSREGGAVRRQADRAFLFSETILCHIVRGQMRAQLQDDADVAQCDTCKETKVVRTVLEGTYIRTPIMAKDKGIRNCARCYFKLIGVEPEGDDEQLDALFARHAAG